jgi:HlyD family secretion protein
MKRIHPLALVLVVMLAGCRGPEQEQAKPVVDVKVAKAELADVKLIMRAPASVFAREQANLSARITAPIATLAARKGDNVSRGQLLARLDNRDLLALRDETGAALTDAEANLQKVTSGSLPTDLERARGQLTKARVALEQAEKFFERRKRLFEQGAIPQRDLMVSQTDLAQAKADFEVAQTTLRLLENQSGGKDIVMAKAKLDQARARLGLVQTQLAYAEIRSPFDGVVTEQYMFPGDMAKPDAPIFTVMDLSVAVARAQVPETDAAALRAGEACGFIPADGGGASFEGRITVVNQAVDPARRTIETWCEVPNPKRAIRAGAFGQVAIVTGVAAQSVVVPLAAVQFAEGTRKGSVMVVTAGNSAVKKDVEVGQTSEDRGQVQIRSGLKAGEVVVIEGGYGLPAGTRIRIQEGTQP